LAKIRPILPPCESDRRGKKKRKEKNAKYKQLIKKEKIKITFRADDFAKLSCYFWRKEEA
jgi:cytochrome c oxidase assembly protein Cox11